MARTVDTAAHLVRREAFVSAATRLFQTKGYDEASVQDILDAVGASRGAFYHYFDSKGALLDAVVEQMVGEALRAADPQLDAPALTALDRLRALVDGIAAWKIEHAELALAVAETWLSDHNALVRERFRHLVSQRLTPLLARIVRQGTDEGSFVTHGSRRDRRGPGGAVAQPERHGDRAVPGDARRVDDLRGRAANV